MSKQHLSVFVLVILFITCTFVQANSKTKPALAKQFDAQFEQLLKSDITNLSYSEQQKALQEHVKQINKLTKNQKDLQVAWQSLDRLEAKIKKEYMENNKKVILAQAKLTKACKLVGYYKTLLQKLQIEIVKIKISAKKRGKLANYYAKLVKKYKSEMKKAFDIYKASLRISKETYSEFVKTSKQLEEQIKIIKLQLQIIELMKQKLYSTQGLELEISTMFEEWETIVREEESEHVEQTKCNCPIVYRPVCGINGLTYNSACTARCADVDVHYYGACKCIPQEVIIVRESVISGGSFSRD